MSREPLSRPFRLAIWLFHQLIKLILIESEAADIVGADQQDDDLGPDLFKIAVLQAP